MFLNERRGFFFCQCRCFIDLDRTTWEQGRVTSAPSHTSWRLGVLCRVGLAAEAEGGLRTHHSWDLVDRKHDRLEPQRPFNRVPSQRSWTDRCGVGAVWLHLWASQTSGDKRQGREVKWRLASQDCRQEYLNIVFALRFELDAHGARFQGPDWGKGREKAERAISDADLMGPYLPSTGRAQPRRYWQREVWGGLYWSHISWDTSPMVSNQSTRYQEDQPIQGL